MINFAHRGASGDYPENTIIAFKKAIKLGADGIELDVHKSKDNELVVIHDEDVERTYIGKGLVKDYTLKELKKLKNRKILFKWNKKARIPTLEEVIKLLKGNKIRLNIEIKNDIIEYKNIEKDVINLVKKYNIENRVIISSFNHETIKICKEIEPKIKTGLLYDKKIEGVIEYAKSIKADAIHPNKKLVKKELIKEAKMNNIKVNIYTVNDPKNMRKAIKAGVDGIFTDYPALLKEVIEEVQKLR